MHLDGELFGGRGKFQSTVSIVKTPEDDRWAQLTFQVFDAPNIGTQPFEKRYEAIKEYFEKNRCKYVVVVEETRCKSTDHLKSELKRIETLGGEGVMLREPASKYERRRSKTLLKLKSFHDAEVQESFYNAFL
jgi:DNA ligase-1